MRRKFLSLIILLFTVTVTSAFADCAFSPFSPKENEILYYQETYPINAINPSVLNNIGGSMYPGLRGANQLIIYTQDYGFSTGTNEFGGEAIVSGNIVSSLSGADSLIPNNGLVISGHGRAKKWINDNIYLGSKIYINRNNMTITSYTTSDSFIFGASEKIYEATSMVDYYQKNFPLYDSQIPNSYIRKARRYLYKAEKCPAEVQQYATLAISSANSALATSIPYKQDELKGIWIRPDLKSADEIAIVLDKLANTGINHIFLETYYHGKTIFPSQTMKNYGFNVQNPIYNGYDPLKIWISEAHKRNIKVNIWFESFYLGNNSPTSDPLSIVSKKPLWINKNFRSYETMTPTPSVSEHNGYFLDPANPEVQDFLITLLREIIVNYKPDGINLDYIRYPQSVAARYPSYIPSNWGYTQFARDEFKTTFGEDPINITTQNNLWLLWCQYRQNKVTKFVEKASKLCKTNQIDLTAVVFPNKTSALETKQQDWVTWSLNNYIDAFTPLFLTGDSNTIKSMIFDFIQATDSRSKLYAGLFVTFMGGSEEDLIRQIHETRKLNLGGVVLFDYAHFDEKYIKAVTTSAFIDKMSKTSVPEKKIRYFKLIN